MQHFQPSWQGLDPEAFAALAPGGQQVWSLSAQIQQGHLRPPNVASAGQCREQVLVPVYAQLNGGVIDFCLTSPPGVWCVRPL